VCCRVVQRVGVCCSALQCFAVRCSAWQKVLQSVSSAKSMNRCAACVSMCCSLVQCVAVCGKVFPQKK